MDHCLCGQGKGPDGGLLGHLALHQGVRLALGLALGLALVQKECSCELPCLKIIPRDAGAEKIS